MRRVWLPVLVLAALVVPALPAAAEDAAPPAAPAAPAAAGAPSPSDIVSLLASFDPDGGACTGVPDAIPPIFDFTASCQQHDACYAQAVDRQACDVAFRQNMIGECDAQHPSALDANRYACLSFAELYFLGVRVFGGFFFPSS
jgi:hypothetical protein